MTALTTTATTYRNRHAVGAVVVQLFAFLGIVIEVVAALYGYGGGIRERLPLDGSGRG